MSTRFGKMLRYNDDLTIPTDNPFFTTRDRGQSGDLGPWAAEPVHVRVPARNGAHVHQRRGRDDLGGGERGRGRLELRLADDRRPDDQPQFPRRRSTRTATAADWSRASPSSARRSTIHRRARSRRPTSGTTSSPTTSNGWINRLDPANDNARLRVRARIGNQVFDLEVGPDGALYALSQRGELPRVPVPVPVGANGGSDVRIQNSEFRRFI